MHRSHSRRATSAVFTSPYAKGNPGVTQYVDAMKKYGYENETYLPYAILRFADLRKQIDNMPKGDTFSLDKARWVSSDVRSAVNAQAEGLVILGIIAFADVPRIPLFQPSLDVAMQRNIAGYRYWFHRQLDYRPLAKT